MKGGEVMFRMFTSTDQLRYGQLMDVYAKLNREKAEASRRRDINAAVLLAEQDMYDYLKHCFFKRPGSFLAVWEVAGKYVSAVRVERYHDGWLVNALETAECCRRKGYARALLHSVFDEIEGPVYSHVHKLNGASLNLHRICGFQIISDESELLNGSVSKDHYTLRWLKES